MKNLKKKLAIPVAGFAALFASTTAHADGNSYSYYECNLGVCTLITCIVVENDLSNTTQEICFADDLGGGFQP